MSRKTDTEQLRQRQDPIEGDRLVDSLGRPLEDLRISLTDRCNFRCPFCMPADRDYRFLPRDQILSFEEITRLARIFVGLGVRKVRLTGGEPLLRRDLPHLVESLAAIEGIEDLALTTNGVLLPRWAEDLAAAGLRRVTVSLHTLRADRFAELSGAAEPGLEVPDEAGQRRLTRRRRAGVAGNLEGVVAGIDAACRAGLRPVKLNTVVMKGRNDDEIADLATFARSHGCEARFIEFMDVGNVNSWRPGEVVSREEILEAVAARFPHEEEERERPSQVARNYRYLDGRGRFGVIASVSSPFCGDCSRIRLSASGSLYTCLFSTAGRDLRAPLREGAGEDELAAEIRALWARRADRYSELRAVRVERRRASAGPGEGKVEMYHIGG